MTNKQYRLVAIIAACLILATAIAAVLSALLREPTPEPTYTVLSAPTRLHEPRKIQTVQHVSIAHAAAPVEPAETELESIEEVQEPERISLGEFRLTAYCSCEICCGEWALNRPNGIVYTASGTEAQAGRTIAVDPDVIPYGTTVYIDGQAYVAEDCGGAIQDNSIDIYFDDHDAALQFGLQYGEVEIQKGE